MSAEPAATRLARLGLEKAEAALADGDAATALRWLDRCHRLLPHDHHIALQLALALLAEHPARAEPLFARVAAAQDLRDAWFGLAAARLRCGDSAGAALALGTALSRHAISPGMAAIADPVTASADGPGWCGLTADGELVLGPDPAQAVILTLDGTPLRGRRLPGSWSRNRRLDVRVGDTHLLGSPIDIATMRRVEGFVEAWAGGLRGWAWLPKVPERDPVLTIRGGGRQPPLTITASDLSEPIADCGPLPWQRRFVVPAAELAALTAPLHVTGPDGRDLMGSPLDPRAESDGAAAAARAIAARYPVRSRRMTPEPGPILAIGDADVAVSGPVEAPCKAGIVTIIVLTEAPAARALAQTLDSLPPGVPVIVVDDAIADPALTIALDGWAAADRLHLIRHARPAGFAAAANAGLAAVADRDAVLLGGPVEAPAGWLQRLADAAYQHPATGCVTPLSSAATFSACSAPGSGVRLPRRTAPDPVPIPAADGPCLFIRHDCLRATGLLRADLFAQGPGATVDFCRRAHALGFRTVALPGLIVTPAAAAPPQSLAVRHLAQRNQALLHRLHPGLHDRSEAFRRADPLARARRQVDQARWRAAAHSGQAAALLITHAEGGGVEQRIIAAATAHRAAGRRPIVLRPVRRPDGTHAVEIGDGPERDYPSLHFDIPDELAILSRFVTAQHPTHVEVHHLVDYHPSIYRLLSLLGLPYDVHVHDYPWFCQRISLVGRHDRYCGEPDVAGCEACVADCGRLNEEEIAVTAMLERSATFLAAARRVIAPSDDAAQRMRRHFPALRPVVVPHEDDAAIPPPAPPRARDGLCRVCVVGAVGVHKGFEILLDCGRDAAARDLPLEFVLVGTSIDDARLMGTGRIFVTGRYWPEEAVELIRNQNASLGLLPSIWPETWCLTLSELWRAGLPVASFDLGAPAERIRRSGWGFVLPPGLPPASVNNRLVASVGLSAQQVLLPSERK
jgi:glycosyltransferase involved in cell wall biosynthesis